MSKYNAKLWLVLILLICAPLLIADVGPKPTAEFEIEYLIEPIPNLADYALYQCDLPDCSDQSRLEQLGPQNFECTQYVCTSMAYGYAEYMYIELVFDDGSTRASNIFTKDKFNARYQVTVNQSDLYVEEIGGSNWGSPSWFGRTIFPVFLLLCCGGLVFGVIIIGVVLILINSRKRNA